MFHDRPATRSYPIVVLVLMAVTGGALLFARVGFAKPAVADVPGQVVRMDASPVALERRALREALKVEQVALAELRAQLLAATDDDTRSDLAVAFEARKNSTRVRLLEVRIEHARARGEQAAAAKLESRRAQLVQKVGERMPCAPASEQEVAR